MSEKAAHQARAVRLVGLDIDGTLTDGRIVISAKGELAKSFSVHDGQGMRLLIDNGISVAFITARKSRIVTARARELGIEHVLQGVKDKASALRKLAESLSLDPNQTAFMGDDLPDLPAMAVSGLPACVANAAPELKARAIWQSTRDGGDGAVREFAEFILKSQNLWDIAVARFTQTDSQPTSQPNAATDE
jgi:3-deoxy-D-manno-octulosonate 8-phosphate phosphatase (KDO 8-P phosphatase)